MEEEITKAIFLADFFCSPLAAEVYKNNIDNLLVNRLSLLSSVGDSLWKKIEECIPEDEEDWSD